MPSNWLVKTEPDVYSLADLKREKRTLWDGVRNYQARNYLKQMKAGDLVLFYHSSCEEIGVVGLARVTKVAVPDPLQFEKHSDYFDPDSTKANPRWWSPEIEFVSAFKTVVGLNELRSRRELEKMLVLQRGSRLSVHPVSDRELEVIMELGGESTDSVGSPTGAKKGASKSKRSHGAPPRARKIGARGSVTPLGA
jgi:predicted RNA-binding protein with PUA-like domain